MWLFSCALVAFLAILFEPWPLSLRQGPDTAAAKAGFADVFGADPADGVPAVYYRKKGAWNNSVIYMRFDIDQPARLASLANAAGLVAYASDAPLPSPPDGPSWWDARSLDTATMLYVEVRAGHVWRGLWLPADSTTAYYFDFWP